MSKVQQLAFTCVLIISACCQIAVANSIKYLDIIPPPIQPDDFKNHQELKDYLVKLHKYYSHMSRPRFGRSYQIDGKLLSRNNHDEFLVLAQDLDEEK